VYFNLHKARVALEGAASALQQYLDTNTTRIGEMLALSGMTYVYFAENYCSAVPFSARQPDGSILYGTPETTTGFSIGDLALRFSARHGHAGVDRASGDCREGTGALG